MSSRHKKYPHLAYRKGVWREIVRFVAQDTGYVESLVELAPGFCDFINQFPAPNKICYEVNPDMAQWAASSVDFRCKDAGAISELENESADVVFASNFLEHLDDVALNLLIPKVHHVLKKGGFFVLIQPNYRLCKEHYFDDETHQTVFSNENVGPFVEKYGFAVHKIIPGILPFQMKSRLPKWPILVRIYLASPIRPGAAQMYVVAQKE